MYLVRVHLCMGGNSAHALGDRREGLLGDRQPTLRPRRRRRLKHHTRHLRQQRPARSTASQRVNYPLYHKSRVIHRPTIITMYSGQAAHHLGAVQKKKRNLFGPIK